VGGLALLLGAGLALLWAVVVAHTAWMLTHPARRTYAAAVARGLPGDPGELPGSPAWESFTVVSRGARLACWRIAGGRADGPVVVMTHGWADSRVGALVRVGAVLPWCSWAVAWDLPGHGESDGRCDLGASEGTDLERVISDAGGSSIVLFGWSMGAGVSLEAAGCAGVAGVIAEAPYRTAFSPARNVLRGRGMPWRATLWPALALVGAAGGRGPGWMLRGSRFDRAGVARGLGVPLLVVHGEADVVSPHEEGRAIAEAGGGEFLSVPGGTHNGLWTDERTGSEAGRAVEGFLRRIVGAT
jgi:pimeloyl-ACP methyl ester carboxylesterase